MTRDLSCKHRNSPRSTSSNQNILTLCTRINAATYELLTMIREFDERTGWLQWGLSSCAEWLAWRCDLSMTTAREKVRVAHALKTLPAIAGSFSSGELSYAKARELTRVADRDNRGVTPRVCIANDGSQRRRAVPGTAEWNRRITRYRRPGICPSFAKDPARSTPGDDDRNGRAADGYR